MEQPALNPASSHGQWGTCSRVRGWRGFCRGWSGFWPGRGYKQGTKGLVGGVSMVSAGAGGVVGGVVAVIVRVLGGG